MDKFEFVANTYIKPYFSNKTNENTTDSAILNVLNKIGAYHPLLENSINTAKPYMPGMNKTNLIYFLLIILCWEGNF